MRIKTDKYDGKKTLIDVWDSDIVNGKLTIPGEVDAIADDLCAHRDDIIELAFEDGVKKVGKSSFSCMASLEKISKFSNTLTSIGWGSFYGNKKLKEIPPFPDSLKEIGSWAFKSSAIPEIKMNKWIHPGVMPFCKCDDLLKVTVGDKTYNFKTFKPYYSSSEDTEIIELLMDSEIINPVFNKRGLTVYQGIVWRDTMPDDIKNKEPRIILNCYVSEYKKDEKIYAGVGSTFGASIQNLRQNFKIPEFYEIFGLIYKDKITHRISFENAVKLYSAATGVLKQDIGQFLMANGYMDKNWNPKQDNFMAKELACISKGLYGHKTFMRYMLGFCHPRSYQEYNQGGHSYTFYGIDENLHECDKCSCFQRNCEFAKTLKTNSH